MKTRLIPVAIVCLLLAQSSARSQSTPLPRFEAAAEFTTLGRDAFAGVRTEPGVGGRFTVNMNEVFAFETAAYIFPRKCFDCVENGRMTQAVAGVKIGKRFEHWGVFGKARPGVVSYSVGTSDFTISNPFLPFVFGVERRRVTSFATDVGGVVEFYPSPRIVTRFDMGDTIIYHRRRTQEVIVFNPVNGSASLFPFTRPARTDHQFQFVASVGFRF
ncbi:MAG TPA: hypothetical protein VFZ22_10275 [Pyrinomonadaceae bacterium]|nr:hypothetical protein [Pyrinomonadaceae bacterium]